MEEILKAAINAERERIALAIEALNINKDISSDWYQAGITTRNVCAIIARSDLNAEKVLQMGDS